MFLRLDHLSALAVKLTKGTEDHMHTSRQSLGGNSLDLLRNRNRKNDLKKSLVSELIWKQFTVSV